MPQVNEGACVGQLKLLATSQARRIHDALQAPLAVDQMRAVANSSELLKYVKTGLKEFAGTPEWSPGNLAVSLTAGRRRQRPFARGVREKCMKVFSRMISGLKAVESFVLRVLEGRPAALTATIRSMMKEGSNDPEAIPKGIGMKKRAAEMPKVGMLEGPSVASVIPTVSRAESGTAEQVSERANSRVQASDVAGVPPDGLREEGGMTERVAERSMIRHKEDSNVAHMTLHSSRDESGVAERVAEMAAVNMQATPSPTPGAIPIPTVSPTPKPTAQLGAVAVAFGPASGARLARRRLRQWLGFSVSLLAFPRLGAGQKPDIPQTPAALPTGSRHMTLMTNSTVEHVNGRRMAVACGTGYRDTCDGAENAWECGEDCESGAPYTTHQCICCCQLVVPTPQPTPSPTDAGFSYVQWKSAGQCCRNDHIQLSGNSYATTPAECAPLCDEDPACLYFDHSTEWSNCNTCADCDDDYSHESNYALYTSWAKAPTPAPPQKLMLYLAGSYCEIRTVLYEGEYSSGPMLDECHDAALAESSCGDLVLSNAPHGDRAVNGNHRLLCFCADSTTCSPLFSTVGLNIYQSDVATPTPPTATEAALLVYAAGAFCSTSYHSLGNVDTVEQCVGTALADSRCGDLIHTDAPHGYYGSQPECYPRVLRRCALSKPPAHYTTSTSTRWCRRQRPHPRQRQRRSPRPCHHQRWYRRRQQCLRLLRH
ncbi:unnamed protein product [Prorocentrum cordatum]|uniref:Uncharacterized protein n=1 Tax=Prorocentrum cordatum TaxID=2364126 RepID=A0ABN9UYE6_9DINO|nr:unnamed protein product [Polarella glacialis]